MRLLCPVFLAAALSVLPLTASAETVSAVYVNQLGYLPDGPKRATVVSDAADPLPFVVTDFGNNVVFSGKTEPRGFDISAGESVHVADFSALNATGGGFTLSVADEASSYPFSIVTRLYSPLRTDAAGYFYIVRSGIEIDGDLAGTKYARPAGHASAPSDGALNKGDADVPCQTSSVSREVYGEPWTCDYTLSAVGGWYDAGDQGKYVVSGAISASQLISAWEWSARAGGTAMAMLDDGALRIPESGNGVPDILDEARWELDFIEKMIVPAGEPMAGMVHHKLHDQEWVGLPTLPHEDTRVRELHRPSTAATLDAAAVFAQAARVFARHDPDYAAHALVLARAAYKAAQTYPAVYAPIEDGNSGGGAYADFNVEDEFYWAAAELFISTGEGEWLAELKASSLWAADIFLPGGFNWADVAPYARLQLVLHSDLMTSADADLVRKSFLADADRLIAIQEGNPFGHAYAPDGGQYDWGSSHLVAQTGLILAAAFEISGDGKYRDAAIETADYILGRNAMNTSYVTGYGTVFSQNQFSFWLAHQVDPDLPGPPNGSLAGGPNSSINDPVVQELFAQKGCPAQKCYVDDIGSWSTNEIAINWNAALVQFATWLALQ